LKEDLIINNLKEKFQTDILEASTTSPRRVTVRVTQAILLDVIKFLRDEFKFYHLSTITGLDKGDFEMQYHFANELAVVTVSTMVPRAELKMKSICAIIPGAVLYEREIQDMFGITVENIPDPRPLVMPDDWEEGNYPLRKDWKFERKPEVIPGEKNGD